MAGGSRMQVAPARRMRSGIAIVACAWLLLAGVLSLRHEADVAHAVDNAGVTVHASRAVGHHGGAAAHLHTRGGSGHAGEACALCASMHPPAAPLATPALAASRIDHRAVAAPAAARDAVGSSALFRLAPKTSPPLA